MSTRAGSPLSGIPIRSRRRLAATLGLFVVLFVAVGAVAATGQPSAAAPVFSVLALIVAAFLALMAWGVQRSVKIDVAEQRMDRAIERTVAAHDAMCGCGHDHDPNEMRVSDALPPADACTGESAGAACTHDCQTCLPAGLRSSPSQTRP